MHIEDPIMKVWLTHDKPERSTRDQCKFKLAITLLKSDYVGVLSVWSVDDQGFIEGFCKSIEK